MITPYNFPINLTIRVLLNRWSMTNKRSNAAATIDVITNTASSPKGMAAKIGTKLSTTMGYLFVVPVSGST